MNHKKKKAKNQRAGCLMCKPWKINGMVDIQASVKRKMTVEQDLKSNEETTEETLFDWENDPKYSDEWSDEFFDALGDENWKLKTSLLEIARFK